MKRGIQIDVVNKTLREVEFESIKDMYRIIDCDTFDCVRVNDALDVWVDDEGLLKDDGKTFFWMSGLHQPLKGNGLLTGGVDDDGRTLPCHLSLGEAKEIVKFL